MTIVIDNIRNPDDAEISSNFVVETLFIDVVVTQNTEFGRTTFTSAPSKNFFIFSWWRCKLACLQLLKQTYRTGINLGFQIYTFQSLP